MKVKGEDRLITVLYPAASLADSLKVLSGVMKRPAPGCLQQHADPAAWEDHLAHAIPLAATATSLSLAQSSLYWCLVSSPCPPPFFSLKAPLNLHHPSPNQSHLSETKHSVPLPMCPAPTLFSGVGRPGAIHPHIF